LAAGFFGFYHHAGVLTALEENGIHPARISGTSAGALTASLYATGMNGREIGDFLVGLERNDFWDVHWPWTRRGFGLLAGHRFSATLSKALSVHSFEACRIPLTVTAYDLGVGRVRHFSSGPLIPAVYASCAYPYLFTPAEIEGKHYWDGGFGEKTPLVPFLEPPDVEVVIVSYLPPSGEEKEGVKEFVPSLSSMFAFSPRCERIERDKMSVKLLRENGKRVVVCAPERVELGPFSMDKAREAFQQGLEGMIRILESEDEELLGCEHLS
jgi:predicted acylesterase/phospholipase RssA